MSGKWGPVWMGDRLTSQILVPTSHFVCVHEVLVITFVAHNLKVKSVVSQRPLSDWPLNLITPDSFENWQICQIYLWVSKHF